jgi:hypothetical protein
MMRVLVIDHTEGRTNGKKLMKFHRAVSGCHPFYHGDGLIRIIHSTGPLFEEFYYNDGWQHSCFGEPLILRCWS